jgi:hypothetical protein
LGGTNDIISSSSSETAGVTQLNFFIPLNSGDSFDRVLNIGQTYTVSLGRGQNGTDNFTGPHLEFANVQFTIEPPVANQDETIPVPESTISLSLSPNPFVSLISVRAESKNNSDLTLQVFDAKGRELEARMIKANEPVSLDLGSYPAGLYYVKAANSEGSITGKALKLR